MLRAVSSALALLLVFVGVVAAVNPEGEMPWHPFEPLVQDAAYQKLKAYEARAEPPTLLVLGTSRGMTFDPADVSPPGTGFNFAFAGGEIGAARLVYDHAKRENGAPDRVVYILDQFAVRNPGHLRIEDSAAFPTLAPGGRSWLDVAAAVPRLVTPQHGEDTVRLLAAEAAGRPPQPQTFGADGWFNTTAREQAIQSGALDQQAAMEDLWARVLAPTYSGDRQADPRQVAALRDWLAEARADGVEVDVVLPPFHPWALDQLRDRPTFDHYLQATRGAVLAECSASLSFFDYTELDSFGGSPDFFYDAYHMTATNAHRLAAAVQKGHGDECADA